MEKNEYITDEQVVKRAKAAVRLAIEKKNVLGSTIVAYDSENNEIYQINNDGSRTVLGKGIGGDDTVKESEQMKESGLND